MKISVRLGILGGLVWALGACAGDEEPVCLVSPALPVDSVPVCPDTTGLPLPADPQTAGPWKVGVQTVQLGGLTTEIWYPARPGSEQCSDQETYDLRVHLPESEKDKISDEDVPLQICDCYRDLPLDGARGPYPVVLWAHGAGSFRTMSLSLMTHWASRGMVVIAADHPGTYLGDLLGFLLGISGPEADGDADLRAMVADLQDPTGSAEFLRGHVDLSRIGAGGHSAGGRAIENLGDIARVIFPLASVGTGPGPLLEQSMIIGGVDDGVILFNSTRNNYELSPSPKRLFGIDTAGHSFPTDLCTIGADRGGMFKIAIDSGITIVSVFETLASDGCQPENLDAYRGLEIVRYATTALLEDHVNCGPDSGPLLDGLPSVYPEVTVAERQ